MPLRTRLLRSRGHARSTLGRSLAFRASQRGVSPPLSLATLQVAADGITTVDENPLLANTDAGPPGLWLLNQSH